MEDCQEDLGDRDHLAHQDILDQYTNNSTTTTGYFRCNCIGNTFGMVGQSMLKLARAQDQTNRYLQEHLQQGHINMQAHTGALQQLATSTYQQNFDHIFTSIPINGGSDREGFFPWLEHLEAACFYSGRNIKTGSFRKISRTSTKYHIGFAKFSFLESNQRRVKKMFL